MNSESIRFLGGALEHEHTHISRIFSKFEVLIINSIQSNEPDYIL